MESLDGARVEQISYAQATAIIVPLHLDHADVDVLFEQMGGEAVPQGVRRHALGDSRQVLGGVHGAVELAGRHWIDRVLARKQPGLRPRRPPPFAQQFEQLRGEHDIAIPLPFAPLDPKRHALAVDVGHLQATTSDTRRPAP